MTSVRAAYSSALVQPMRVMENLLPSALST
jgi:hypothetical protein